MKALLIAAGLMVASFGAVPATAAPIGGNAPAIEAPQAPQALRDGRHHNRGDRWNNNRRGHRWGNRGRHCRSVRRGHRWVRVCGRR